jgi:hypothetical protein
MRLLVTVILVLQVLVQADARLRSTDRERFLRQLQADTDGDVVVLVGRHSSNDDNNITSHAKQVHLNHGLKRVNAVKITVPKSKVTALLDDPTVDYGE